jgi:hypothetical protein
MVTSASKGVHGAAGIVCAVFVPFVLIHLLWAVGITWGLKAMWGGGSTDASLGLTFASRVGAAAGAAVIFVTLARVCWLKIRLPNRLVHIGAWIAFAWPAIGTLSPASTWGQRAVALPLAIAAFVVAPSHPRPDAGQALRPPVTRALIPH